MERKEGKVGEADNEHEQTTPASRKASEADTSALAAIHRAPRGCRVCSQDPCYFVKARFNFDEVYLTG
jgi:hypothetical protein